ncbi:four helix bundle protein [Marinomonas shanghaiensis]|uniref:four helix bundle protein n=1 Tax=Marinomonas shanghaiensis TaxID=2202418 RepID=UPI000DBA8921|nr:four helix bundle protein [Marinomonas shanghaiensis]
MQNQNAVLDKSFQFSIRIVKLYKYLVKQHKEFVLSKQLLRSGTSIGANVNEVQAAQSKADFTAKMSVASKEAREAQYWINLLIKTDYLNITEPYVETLLVESSELTKLLTSIVKTSQGKK